MPCVDVAFRLMGAKVPVDHGYGLSEAVNLVALGAGFKKGFAYAGL